MNERINDKVGNSNTPYKIKLFRDAFNNKVNTLEPITCPQSSPLRGPTPYPF